MSDIQRWTLPHDGYAFQSDDGGYVTYADHVAALLTQDRQHMEQQAAAVAAAEQRGYVAGVERESRAFNYAYNEGVQAARDAAIAAGHDGCADAERAEGYEDGYADALERALVTIDAENLMGAFWSSLDESETQLARLVLRAAAFAIDKARGES